MQTEVRVEERKEDEVTRVEKVKCRTASRASYFSARLAGRFLADALRCDR